MTEQELVKAIAYRMGNVRNQDDAIRTELGMTINRLEDESFHPWFLLSENNFYEGKAGENRVPVPAGFLVEYEEGALYLDVDGVPVELTKKSQDQLKPEMIGQGRPVAYALTNKYFRLFPVPSEDYKVEMLFYRRSSTLNEQVNPWYIHATELVMAETLWAMFAARKSKNADYWKGVAEQQRQRLLAKDAERREANREITFGGDY